MATDNAPAPATPPPVRSAGETSTNVLSVRLPSAELRRALTAKCEQDDVSVAKFIAMVAEEHLDGRLLHLPSAELGQALTAKCEQDRVSVDKFLTMVTEAYLDGRLRIVEKESPRPSFLIPADADPDR